MISDMTEDEKSISEAFASCKDARLPDDFADRLARRIRENGENPANKTIKTTLGKHPGWGAALATPAERTPAGVESQLVRLDPQDATEAIAKPAWLDSGYQRVDPETGVAPARDGLFPARTARGVLIAALATASPVQGGLLMLMFGLGTLPTLMAMGMAAVRLKAWLQRPWLRRLSGVLVLLFGVVGLIRLWA